MKDKWITCIVSGHLVSASEYRFSKDLVEGISPSMTLNYLNETNIRLLMFVSIGYIRTAIGKVKVLRSKLWVQKAWCRSKLGSIVETDNKTPTIVKAPSLNNRSLSLSETATGVFLLDSLEIIYHKAVK